MYRIFMIGYSEKKGGVEAYIKNLNENLDHEKLEVIYSEPNMCIDGKTWIPPKNRHNYLKYRLFWKKFYTENHFDVLYLNTCDVVSIDDLKFATKAGIPVRIIHSHCTGIQQGIDHKLSLFHRVCERHNRKVLDKFATHLFACSKAAGEWMFDGRPFQVIQNGIQISKYNYNEKFREKIRSKYKLVNTDLIGMIGRLSPQKNPFFTIDLAKDIFNKMPNAKIVMVGNGEMREDLEREVKLRKLQEKIIFIGAVDNVNEWMSAIDCLLMPSLFEGLPFVLVEAQASGLNCVVSTSVSKESNITGLVHFVDLNADKQEWVEKIIYYSHKKRCDTNEKLINAGYSIEFTAKKVTDIILYSLRSKVVK